MRPGAGFCLTLLIASSGIGAVRADTYPPITTTPLCGPGTNWLSLPTHSDMMIVEDLCLAIGPAALTITQRFPDGTGTYAYDCTAPIGTGCLSAMEPGCSGSCFCVDPGEGFEVTTGGPTSLPINGCDEFIPLDLPFAVGPGLLGTLVSVPYSTFLVTANDLGNHFGLPNSGLQRGVVTRFNCATGLFESCNVGTAGCDSLLLVPGQAYRLRNTTSTPLTAQNPVACIAPAASPCSIDTLTVTPGGGGSNILDWSPPSGCTLPLDYEVARGDLDCLAHHCSHCASCITLGTTTLTTFTDPNPPATGVWYLVRVDGDTWNTSSGCTNRDIMFSLGCP